MRFFNLVQRSKWTTLRRSDPDTQFYIDWYQVMPCVILITGFLIVWQKWKVKETLIFFKIVPLSFDTLIPLSSLLVETPLNQFFDIVWSCVVVLEKITCTFSIINLELNFLFRKKYKSQRTRGIWWAMHLHNTVSSKSAGQKLSWMGTDLSNSWGGVLVV